MNSWHTKVRVQQGQGEGASEGFARVVCENGTEFAMRAIFFGKHDGI